jgi:hypothetical protein
VHAGRCESVGDRSAIIAIAEIPIVAQAPSKVRLVATCRQVEQGWYVVHDVLEREGHSEVQRSGVIS